jgi:pimeloyl-ACP methyl ester carboxylesterase
MSEEDCQGGMMSDWLLGTIIFIGVGAGLWLVSHIVEALRRAPAAPQALSWAPEIPIGYVDMRGCKLRYTRAGRGPNLVLLHTLRTQLDLFEKVVPGLARHFTVYALDYPGHGYSDIPKTGYDAPFFTGAVEGFLEALDLRDVTLCGVSIGGTISLMVAGHRNRRVARVIAINPYDYAAGRGMARSSFLGGMIVLTSAIPVIGETVMRLRNFMIMKAVLRGGVANAESIPPALLREMYDVGNRRGHYRAFIRLLRNSPSWEAATIAYADIDVPVLVIWGDQDWSRVHERDEHCRLLPGAEFVTIQNGGHFLPLDRPDAVVEQIRAFGLRIQKPDIWIAKGFGEFGSRP